MELSTKSLCIFVALVAGLVVVWGNMESEPVKPHRLTAEALARHTGNDPVKSGLSYDMDTMSMTSSSSSYSSPAESNTYSTAGSLQFFFYNKTDVEITIVAFAENRPDQYRRLSPNDGRPHAVTFPYSGKAGFSVAIAVTDPWSKPSDSDFNQWIGNTITTTDARGSIPWLSIGQMQGDVLRTWETNHTYKYNPRELMGPAAFEFTASDGLRPVDRPSNWETYFTNWPDW